MSSADLTASRRLQLRVRGAVQGVGFRPFVHRLAARHGLAGFVLNDADGVLAEVEGVGLDGFLGALHREKPPLARIDHIDIAALASDGRPGFTIRASVPGAGQSSVVPDAAPCAACLDELFDPASRFHLYPFLTCTQCGPRFTIAHRLPYDRANTAMAGFGMCLACAADYADPASRRFHAETIACPSCGPRMSHPIAQIATALRQGQIVALKGIGCFQLLCDATNEAAVDRLRDRKGRPAKPFAVMVANEASAASIATEDPIAFALLGHVARPIVLLRDGGRLAASVAPRLRCIGVMLPSAPAHHLVFQALSEQPGGPVAIVVTSANQSGAPPLIDDGEARSHLAGIADMVVTHNRPILVRADDSVMAVINGRSAFIRRSRGFVPGPIDLGQNGPVVLAVGAQLKATLCVTRGREAFLSQHIGDLGTTDTARFYAETARQMLTQLGVVPEIVVCDRHPDYGSTHFAHAAGLPVLQVQHHAAHVAAVAAEHRLAAPVLGVALDGHGYGDDGRAWGGELLLLEGVAWRRLGHLAPLPMPGGDRAAREPWRMGVAALVAMGHGDAAAWRFPDHPLAATLARVCASAPMTTSMGRLFDAAAALLGVCTHQSYEGQGAMEIEALVDIPSALPQGHRINGGVLDFRPLLSALLSLPAREGAALFHGTLIAGLADWIGQAARHHGRKDVALGGGCMVNRVLAEGLADALRARGLVPWLPRAVPANDGGLSLGQAAMARAHLMAGPGCSAVSGK